MLLLGACLWTIPTRGEVLSSLANVSLGRYTSIDSQSVTNHEACGWGAKPYHGTCDLFGLA
jgi:hypothetical protein